VTVLVGLCQVLVVSVLMLVGLVIVPVLVVVLDVLVIVLHVLVDVRHVVVKMFVAVLLLLGHETSLPGGALDSALSRAPSLTFRTSGSQYRPPPGSGVCRGTPGRGRDEELCSLP